MSRIIIAGTGSGCGKTTITCAILGALKQLGNSVVSFKAGPDYIDTMFHKEITGVTSLNLDIFLMGEEKVKYALKKPENNICIIEGAMGLYDGIGSSSHCSANHLSNLTQTPVILVVNAKGKSQSLCAEIQGYINYEQNNIRGIILNNVNESMFSFYKQMIEHKLGLCVLGFMPTLPQAKIKSRNLGLIASSEIEDIKNKMAILAESAIKFINIENILSIASSANVLECPDFHIEKAVEYQKPIIYVSKDSAFCFYYEANHSLLQDLGAELVFFSPLKDKLLPDDADGLILWGGYPELHGKELQNNFSMLDSIRKKIKSGMPVYAECGGFMYLQQTLKDSHGNIYKMLSVLDGNVEMTSSLQNFGYVTLEANHDNMLLKKGDTINAHSFHRSKSNNEGDSFTATKPSTSSTYKCIAAQKNIFGGYPHIHFWGNQELAKNFVRRCCEYRKEVSNGLYN